MVSFSNSRSVLRLHPDDIDENKTCKVETKDEWKGKQGEGFVVMFPDIRKKKDNGRKREKADGGRIYVHLVNESAYIDRSNTKDKTKWDKQPVSSQRANTVSYPYRPHRLSSSMRYFPMISQNFLKIWRMCLNSNVYLDIHIYEN